jgi:hypothetical protein
MNIGVLSGYFDESERPDHSDPIGVAGYLFKPVAYKQFARRWRSDVLSLLPEGALYLHMTDLYAGWDVYHGMSITKRADIFKAAVTVINEHVQPTR